MNLAFKLTTLISMGALWAAPAEGGVVSRTSLALFLSPRLVSCRVTRLSMVVA
jgi:hypothetical protein